MPRAVQEAKFADDALPLDQLAQAIAARGHPMSVLTGDDYLAFCRSLRELCGVDLTQYKRRQMERRLRAFFGRRGISRLTDCIEDLRNDPAQLDALLDRITINVSQLWRNPGSGNC